MASNKKDESVDSLSDLEKKLQEGIEAIRLLKQQGADDDPLIKKYHELEKKLQDKNQAFEELQQDYEKLNVKYQELHQEKLLLTDFSDTTEKTIEETEKKRKDLESKYEQEKHLNLEHEQEKYMLQEQVEIEETEKQHATKKYYKTIIVSAIAIAVVAGVYSVMFAELAGEQYRVAIEPQPTGYTIQNLKGDTVQTWLSWRIVEGEAFHVNILNAEGYDKEVIDAIKRAVASEDMIEIDNSLLFKGPQGTTSEYYVGWQGALQKAGEERTELYIPDKIDIIESTFGEGHITIELTDVKNADGFAGWTNSIADESQNQILKSRITIFAANTLTPTEMETIVRHEFGHALGLAHTTALEDLMAPVIATEYPYISPCDVSALNSLYDGGENSDVTCDI